MKTFTKSFLRSAIFAIFVATLGAGFAQAQYSDGESNNNSNDCSGTSSNGGKSRNDGDNNGNGRNELQVIGLTVDQRLICFGENRPSRASTIGTVSGLTQDTALIGIDFRVQDGKLYGVGNAGGVYTLSRTTAAATFVNRLTVALVGTSFGVDFNPAADRLRVISDTGQNLRHNVNAGGVTINDGALSYQAPAVTTATGVTGAAYTNNDLDATTATTLYDIDTNLDQVAIQSPANNGTLAATGKLTVDATSVAGFDIYSTIRNNVTVAVEGFAALGTAANSSTSFYSIVLATGKATSRGAFSTNNQVADIAITLGQR